MARGGDGVVAASDKHRVEIVFDGGGVGGRLICPEGGCRRAENCSECGRELHPRDLAEQREEGIEPCYDCKDAEQWSEECWIKTWFDNCAVDELLAGEVTVEIDAEWDGDTIIANITDVVPAPEQKSEAQA